MQSEMHYNEIMASDSQAEHNSQVHQQLIHCHPLNNRTSDCSQPSNDVCNICNQNSNINLINDVTGASGCSNCCCAGAEALVPLASSQVECPKQDADYQKLVALDSDDNGACGYSRPSCCEANCRDQHDEDYLQLVADDDYLQLVADDDYL